MTARIRTLLAAVVAAVSTAAFPAVAITATTPTPIGAYTTIGAHSYRSAPNLFPPRIRTDIPTDSKRLAPGLFMIANFKNLSLTQPIIGQGGPLILDHRLAPVWFHPVPTDVVSLNLRAQRLDGHPVLSWWEGVVTNVGAVSSGKEVVVDQHYRKVATLTGAGGWILSPHEMLIRGHLAWVTAYRNEAADLSAFGGPANGTLVDSAVQEYDLRTGRLLYTWDAGAPGHIPLAASEVHPSAAFPWDAYHINSINLVSPHEFVVSMRNTWAGYLVDTRTGAIIWTLGGKPEYSSFTFGPRAAFEWQHDIELNGAGRVTLFDDACCAVVAPGKFGPPVGPSRGLVLKLDDAAHTATLVAQYTHAGISTANQGNMQTLPGGNALVGFGGQPWFSEYSRAGDQLLDARLPGPNVSYRAYLQNWVGLPLVPPAGAARTRHRRSTVYASWNGATKLARWIVLAGRNGKHLHRVASRARNGFETPIALRHAYRAFRVVALDAKRHVIGRSRVFRPGRAKAQRFPPSGL